MPGGRSYNYGRLCLQLREKFGDLINYGVPITQYRLADILETSRSSISHMETGRGRTINETRRKVRDVAVLVGVIEGTGRSGDQHKSVEGQIRELILDENERQSMFSALGVSESSPQRMTANKAAAELLQMIGELTESISLLQKTVSRLKEVCDVVR